MKLNPVEKVVLVCCLAVAAGCLALAAHAVSIDLTATQVSAVCTASGGCGVVVPTDPGTPTIPTCTPGVTHLQGNGCVPDNPSANWNGVCPGYDKTIVLDFPWLNPVRQYTGSMGVNDVIVVRFTTGTLTSASNNLPRVTAAEWGSPPSGRTSVLSATPCDFNPQTWLGAVSAGNSIQVPFAVKGANFGYYPILEFATTYYWNIKNVPNQSCSAQGICDMFVELLKPSGL